MRIEPKTWTRAALLPALTICVALPSFAAEQTQRATEQRASAQGQQQQSYRGLRATQLIGKDVRNARGQDLGEIADLIVDMNTGEIRYSILRFDPGVFAGERLFAVPTARLKMTSDRSEVVYDVTREQLEKSAVERKRWPAAARDRAYLAGLDRTYGIVQPSSDRRAFSASELIGKDVNTPQGNEVGEIRDLVINMNAQKVHYAVMSFDPSWTEPEKVYAFPLSAFRFTDGKDELVLNVSRTTLRAMRSFDHNLWTAMNDVAFVTEMDRHLVTVSPAANTGATR